MAHWVFTAVVAALLLCRVDASLKHLEQEGLRRVRVMLFSMGKAEQDCQWIASEEQKLDFVDRYVKALGDSVTLDTPIDSQDISALDVSYYADQLCKNAHVPGAKFELNNWVQNQNWQAENSEFIAQHSADRIPADIPSPLDLQFVLVSEADEGSNQPITYSAATVATKPTFAHPVANYLIPTQFQQAPVAAQPAVIQQEAGQEDYPEKAAEDFSQSYQQATPASSGGTSLSTFGVFFIGIAGGLMVMYFFHDKLTVQTGRPGIPMKNVRRDTTMD